MALKEKERTSSGGKIDWISTTTAFFTIALISDFSSILYFAKIRGVFFAISLSTVGALPPTLLVLRF